MTRTFHGIAWHVYSPSLYQLVSDHPERVCLGYRSHGWELAYIAADGHTVTRFFRSRDEAMGLIAHRMGVA